MPFKLTSNYQPAGDQPQAIKKLVEGIEQDKKHQVLLGVTGSGKTFTMASVIEKVQKPTLVIAHNKTLAAQLYQEFRDFFPENAVSYFVSYYDYYQPEAYIPTTDTYIEKDSSINEEIDKLRLATTSNLLTRKDVIVVASVSCIYNLGSPVEYGKNILELMEGEIISREVLLTQLSNLQYERSDAELTRGSYRLRGDVIQLWPAYDDRALKIETLENRIELIDWIDPISGGIMREAGDAEDNHKIGSRKYVIYPARHYTVNPITKDDAIAQIREDLAKRLEVMKATGRQLESYRLEQKVNYDLEMIENLGFVNGIENYSRYFDGRNPGDPPFSLLDYFQENTKLFETDGFLTMIDESHMTLPQVRGMYNGDQARKQTLIEYGFRLPSALDNRPLQFDEFLARNDQFVHVSATPSDWEISHAGGEVVEQVIRPTGLIDPEVELRPTQNQIEDLIIEVIIRKQLGQRVLVTTLTKKMAEALTDYLNDPGRVRKLVKQFKEREQARSENEPDRPLPLRQRLPIEDLEVAPIEPQYYTLANHQELQREELLLPQVAYLHSDVDTLDRSDILDDLRLGKYDVLVGINLLREGLDLPEVTLVAILDADKEGFLRSTTSMIQTMGRAARHSDGKAILYADKLTKSMKAAISETYRRREIQLEYNQKHNITPQTISKPIRDRMIAKIEEDEKKKHRASRLQTTVSLTKGESIILEDIDPDALTPAEKKRLAAKLRRRMLMAANSMDFELAAALRDSIAGLS